MPASSTDVSHPNAASAEASVKALTPAQREILQLFALDLPESDWAELRRVIARHFSEKAKAKMNELWDERGWTEADMDRMLHEHHRVAS